jgi:segregation and condensation protein A
MTNAECPTNDEGMTKAPSPNDETVPASSLVIRNFVIPSSLVGHSAFVIPGHCPVVPRGSMSYHVALEAFHGPLDLLLYLVKRNEVDVLDIPVAKLADQFLDHMQMARELDVELAGDFLVLAATLMELKSRSLLPADPEAEEAEADDPRRELVRQLLEYRRFKDAAAALEARAEAAAARVPRTPAEEPAAGGPPPVRAVEVWDLVSAFARLVRETRALATTAVVVDDTPQHIHEQRVLARVRAAGRLAFRELFDPPHHRARLVGLFLAALELVKQQQVSAEQGETFGEIWLVASMTSPSTTPG